MEMDEDTWHLVKEVPKFWLHRGHQRQAGRHHRQGAMSILRRVEEGVDSRNQVLFEPGEVVRVTDGPFTTSTVWSSP